MSLQSYAIASFALASTRLPLRSFFLGMNKNWVFEARIAQTALAVGGLVALKACGALIPSSLSIFQVLMLTLGYGTMRNVAGRIGRSLSPSNEDRKKNEVTFMFDLFEEFMGLGGDLISSLSFGIVLCFVGLQTPSN